MAARTRSAVVSITLVVAALTVLHVPRAAVFRAPAPKETSELGAGSLSGWPLVTLRTESELGEASWIRRVARSSFLLAALAVAALAALAAGALGRITTRDGRMLTPVGRRDIATRGPPPTPPADEPIATEPNTLRG